MDTPQTLQQAIEFFADADRCHAFMVNLRWPSGVVTCPTCNRPNPNYLANQRRFECKGKHSKRQFSVKVGTVMEDSPLPLKHWLLVMWQAANCKNGVSSYEIARNCGIRQKNAWHMLHRVRLAMQDRTHGGGKLDGEVEIDESYIGGKARNMHPRKKHAVAMKRGGGFAGKAVVMGILQRTTADKPSTVKTTVMPNTRKHHLTTEIEKHVEDGTTVYTDSLMSYRGLSAYYQHKVIDHADRYVDGQIHTNGLENYWSLLKRTIGGTYVSVEPFHLFRYLDEQAFRFNNRKLTDAERFTLVATSATGRRLTYAELTGEAA
jgi:transposase-like protein